MSCVLLISLLLEQILIHLWEDNYEKIIYDDCNNNMEFILPLIRKGMESSNKDVSLCLSDIDFIPFDQGDSFNGCLSDEAQAVYEFKLTMESERKVIMKYGDGTVKESFALGVWEK